MILYGGRLSPFVRRIEIWLAVQQRPVERRYVNVFEPDFGGFSSINPLGRVPVLTTDDGLNLFETAAIIDYIEETADPAARLLPASGPERWSALQSIALSHGITEKAVASIYETVRRPAPLRWPEWEERLGQQITQGMARLQELLARGASHAQGAEIAAVCAFDLVNLKMPHLLPPNIALLRDLSEQANAKAAFAETHPSLA